MVDPVITGIQYILQRGTNVVIKSWRDPHEDGYEQIGYRTQYRDDLLDYSDYLADDNIILFHYHDGKVKACKANAFTSLQHVYISQFGIAVSHLYNCFYLPQWEKGLYCFSMDTGELVWRYPLKHAKNTFVYHDFLICAHKDIGVMKLSCKTGEKLDKLTMTTFSYCRQLESTYFIIGPKRNKYYIVDARDFSIVKEMKEKDLTNDGRFLIVEISGTKDALLLVGWENHRICERRIDI